jgi:7-cyano-7-deazaguanine synthase
MSKRTISLLMSGGIDSAVLVPFYRARDVSIHGLHFDYGQLSARAERRAVNAICTHYALPLTIQKLGFSLPCDAGEFRARNALLLLAAAALEPNSSAIAIGIHAGTPYYDCSDAFLGDMRRMVDGYFGGTVSLEAPFLAFDKQHICEFACRTGVPIDLTYSCERTSDGPCGECPSCRDRQARLGHP